MTLDNYVQLHQTIEIHYVVDGWEVQYSIADGNKVERTIKGDSIQEALERLLISLEANPPKWGGPKWLYQK